MQYRQTSKGEQRVRQAVGGVQMSHVEGTLIALLLCILSGWGLWYQERTDKRLDALEATIKRLEGDHK